MTGPEHPRTPPPAIVRRRARVRRIRQSVAAIAAATFIALFAVLYVQMAAGRDPALGATVVQQQSTSGDSSATGSDTGAATSDFATNGSDSTTSDQPAAVTTGQS